MKATIKFGAAAVGLVITIGSLATPADALPIKPPPGGGGDIPIDPDPPEPPDVEQDLTITGNLSVQGCPPGSRPSVRITGTSPWNQGSRIVSTTPTSPTGSAYSVSSLMRGAYTVTPLSPPACPYGIWQAPTAQVPFDDVADHVASVPTMRYQAATRTRIDGLLVTAALNVALGNMQIHLDNYGPRHGQSHHEPNASWVRQGNEVQTFTIPDKQVDLDCGVVCPDLGQGRFYVNDMNSNSIRSEWATTKINVKVGFESNGREVKGWFTDATTGIVSDNLMPDVEIDNAKLTAPLVPVARNGSISFNRTGDPVLSASMHATGACHIFGVDVCNWFTDYKSRITNRVGQKVNKVLDAAKNKDLVATRLRPILDSQGIGTVVKVVMSADSLDVYWIEPEPVFEG